MQGLYEDSDGVLIYVVAERVTRRAPDDCVAWQQLTPVEDAGELHVSDRAEFEARFKRVSWTFKTDIYAILHEHLDRALAYELTKEIEARLTTELHETASKMKLDAVRRIVFLFNKEGPSVAYHEAVKELAALGLEPG